MITDLFYLHEQGTRLAIWQFTFNGTVCLSPIFAGLITQTLGW
jgi:hypothetical protein